MDWLTPYMTQHPELPVFLAIGIGYWIGKFKLKGVGFGPVTGSLIAGLLIGYLFHVPVADTAKQFLFMLFMFGIGYSAGPGPANSTTARAALAAAPTLLPRFSGTVPASTPFTYPIAAFWRH